MATKKTLTTGREGRGPSRPAQLTIHVAKETLDGLAAWARAEGRSTTAQVRFLIEQAVGAHGARMAMTRR